MTKPEREPKAGPNKQQPAKAKVAKVTDTEETNLLGITVKKEENFPEWYTQAIVKSEMVDYYDVSGCYIIRPNSYFIWESIQNFLDGEFKKHGTRNCYFPTFVTKKRLETEKSHVEGFSAEVAWVTRAGSSDLPEPIAIRPTSETIMYPSFARWIRSHRDLPLKVNQWCPVVRWEFKQPTPFIRTREFLWQEGHTAHASPEEAIAFAKSMLAVYQRAYEELLAVPCIAGAKSINEKFAGSDTSFSVEAFIPTNGRGIQAATSHYLGQNFSKMFGIEFEDENRQKQLVSQTSWGFSTRSLGTMVMIHGDDKGMVIPPRVAAFQVVIIPIYFKDEEENQTISVACRELATKLRDGNFRVEVDDRANYKPGWKYAHWEVRGACLRLELGPRDLKAGTVRACRRDNGDKQDLSLSNVVEEVGVVLEQMQKDMFERAKQKRDESIVKISTFAEVMPALNARKLVLAPWCGTPESEEEVKKETQRLSIQQAEQAADAEDASAACTGAMKSLCIPFDQPEMVEGTKCFWTGKPATCYAVFCRSY